MCVSTVHYDPLRLGPLNVNFQLKNPGEASSFATIYNIIIHTYGGQNKIVHSTYFVRRAIFFNIARTFCDQSFNIDLRLRYVVRIHSSENRAMPHPP